MRCRWIPTPAAAVALGLVIVVATAVRVAMVGQGLPYLTNPDEGINLGVGQKMAAHSTILPHFYNYPSMLFDVIAAAMQFGGHANSPSAAIVYWENLGVTKTGAAGTVLTLRLITVALSVGICVVVALTVRRLTGSWLAAGVSGLLIALSPLAVENGVVITPDTYAGFFTGLAIVAALRVAAVASMRSYLLAGVAVGLTAAAKYNAAVVVLSVVTAHVLHHRRHCVARDPLAKLGRSMAATIATFVLITPGIVLDPHKAVHDIRYEIHHYATGHPGDNGHSPSFYASALLHAEVALLILATVGLLAVVAVRYRTPVIVIASFAVPYFILISRQLVHFSRNLMPLLPAVGILAGIGIAQLVAAAASQDLQQRRILAAATGVAVIAAGLSFLQQEVKIHDSIYQPSRALARSWLYEHVPAHSIVVAQPYAPFLDHRYRLVASATALGSLPAGAKAVIVTELADGRYINDPLGQPGQVAAYNTLKAHLCQAAYFDKGPWIRIFVPCFTW